MLTFQYTVGFDSHNYREETIYEKTEEKLLDHKLTTSLSLRQPWGTASGSVDFSQYLTAPSKVQHFRIWRDEHPPVQGILIQRFHRAVAHTGSDLFAERGSNDGRNPRAAAAARDRIPVLSELRDFLFVRIDFQQHRQSALRWRGGNFFFFD
jgi:hypothetical protein